MAVIASAPRGSRTEGQGQRTVTRLRFRGQRRETRSALTTTPADTHAPSASLSLSQARSGTGTADESTGPSRGAGSPNLGVGPGSVTCPARAGPLTEGLLLVCGLRVEASLPASMDANSTSGRHSGTMLRRICDMYQKCFTSAWTAHPAPGTHPFLRRPGGEAGSSAAHGPRRGPAPPAKAPTGLV